MGDYKLKHIDEVIRLMKNKGFGYQRVNGGYRFRKPGKAMTINIDMLYHFGSGEYRPYMKASGNYSHQCRDDGYYYDKMWFEDYRTAPFRLPEELFRI